MPRPLEWLNVRIRTPTWTRYWAFAAVWVAFRALMDREADPVLFWAHVGLSVFVVLIMAVVLWSDKQRPTQPKQVSQEKPRAIDIWMPVLVLAVLAIAARLWALLTTH